jgi:protein-S-isoprenylcysteine O-methyltransferase Ste14
MTTIARLLAESFPQLVVIFYPGVFVYWFIVHNNIERLRAFGSRAFWVAAFAWAITAGPLLIFRRKIFSVRWIPPQPLAAVLLGAGIGAFIVALAIFGKARQQITDRTMVGFPEIEPQKNKQPLLNSGIYARTRNPIYLAHLLLVFSAAAISGFAANWTMFVLDCFVLPLLIRAEERELLTRYGNEFTEYMRRVPRFFPQLR